MSNSPEYEIEHWLLLAEVNAGQYFGMSEVSFKEFFTANRELLMDMYEQGYRPWNAIHEIKTRI